LPTVGILGPFKVKIHARDHNPPHVHFEKTGVQIRVDLTELAILSIRGRPSSYELKEILRYTERYLLELREFWDEFQKED
jgi:hypothetical protein